jgi:hypothetical protein
VRFEKLERDLIGEKKNMRRRKKGLRESSLRLSEALSTPCSGTLEPTGFGGIYEDIFC